MARTQQQQPVDYDTKQLVHRGHWWGLADLGLWRRRNAQQVASPQREAQGDHLLGNPMMTSGIGVTSEPASALY